MNSRRLKSVVHSTAHHAMSGLCYVHPHLGAVCKELGINSVQVGLPEASFDPDLGNIPEELLLSTNALCEKFVEILTSDGISLNDVQEASATFQFLQTAWPVGCCVSARNAKGVIIEASVGSDGNSAEIVRGHS